MILSLDPVQFDFFAKWRHEIRAIRNRESMKLAFKKIRRHYEEIAEMKFEDHVEIDEEQAIAEYNLDLHTAEVMCFDLYWLQETFENDTLIDLSLAIAEELYPEKQWHIIENRNGDMAVTDTERTLVFDMKYCKKLSASASLTLVEDPLFAPSEKARKEIEEFYRRRIEHTDGVIMKAQEHIAMQDRSLASIIPFENSQSRE